MLVAVVRCRSDFTSDTTDAYMLALWAAIERCTRPSDQKLPTPRTTIRTAPTMPNRAWHTWQALTAVRARGRQLSPRSPCFTRSRVVDWCAGNTLTEVQVQICGEATALQPSASTINTAWASASGSQPISSRNHTAM
jgi:hypothetical protein